MSDKTKEILNRLTPEETAELWKFFTRGYVEKDTQFKITVAILIGVVMDCLLGLLQFVK